MSAEDKFNNFRVNNPAIFQKATLLTKDFDTLAKIYDNMLLFNVYMRAECQRHAELAEALWNLKDDSILIYFAEINLYGIFTNDAYLNFCRNINGKIEDEELNAISVYQLVISGKKQKLVFMCTDVDYTRKMCDYARDCFGESVSSTKKQITVNISCNDENEITSAYNKLYNYVREKKDFQCCESMKQIQLLQKFQHGYRECEISESIAAIDNETLNKILKSIPNTPNAPIVIVIGNNNVVNQTVNVKDSTREWIRNNPPNEREITTKYFQRYSDETKGRKVANNVFGTLVREEGYHVIQGSGGRQWSK